MLRTRLPGGHLTPEQYLTHDALADTFANGTLRITTRQCFQFHGLLKGDLQSTLAGLNQVLVTSLAACGDVVRNVACCPAPYHDPIRRQIEAATRRSRITCCRAPRPTTRSGSTTRRCTTARRMRSIRPSPSRPQPRSRSTARATCRASSRSRIAYPGDNCVDVYTQDVGIVAMADGANGQRRDAARLQRAGGRRHGHEPHQGRHLPAPRRPARLRHAGADCSPWSRRSSPCSATTATAPTASTRA